MYFCGGKIWRCRHSRRICRGNHLSPAGGHRGPPLHKPPSDEGGGFCVAKDGGRENKYSLNYLSLSQKSQIFDSSLVRGSLLRGVEDAAPYNGAAECVFPRILRAINDRPYGAPQNGRNVKCRHPPHPPQAVPLPLHRGRLFAGRRGRRLLLCAADWAGC